MSKPFVTRFAPSPTGHLHLGHAYSALLAWQAAQNAGGRFILRIEDIDSTRCRPEFIDAIYEDLNWLGLTWELPVRQQSEHMHDYQDALDWLANKGVIYPCFCTRKDIAEEIARSPSAPHGPEGYHYPGTCRHLSPDRQHRRQEAGEPYALRLDVARAQSIVGDLTWVDHDKGTVIAMPQDLGDVVLARKDTPTSYHLAVTVDDALQGITHVIRGDDLFHATHIHRLLQALLDLPSPQYTHHKLLTDAKGKRFAKRDKAMTLKAMRAAGRSKDDILQELGL